MPWDEAIDHEIDVDVLEAAAGRWTRRQTRVRAARRPTRSSCSVINAVDSSVGRFDDAKQVHGLVRIATGTSTKTVRF